MQRKIELTIGSANGNNVTLTGEHNEVHLVTSRPDKGYGMQEERGAEISMQLTCGLYQELVGALKEVGKAAGWAGRGVDTENKG